MPTRSGKEKADRDRALLELRQKSRRAREEALRKVQEASDATDQMLLHVGTRVRAAVRK